MLHRTKALTERWYFYPKYTHKQTKVPFSPTFHPSTLLLQQEILCNFHLSPPHPDVQAVPIFHKSFLLSFKRQQAFERFICSLPLNVHFLFNASWGITKCFCFVSLAISNGSLITACLKAEFDVIDY